MFGAGLLFWSSLTALLPTLPLYIQDIGGTKPQIGIVMGAFAIGLLLSRAWLGALADRRGRKLLLVIGMTVVAIAPLGYLFIQSIPWLIGVRAFHGVCIAAFATGYAALVADLAPIENRGEVIGYLSLVTPIGMAIGPAVGGFLQVEAGYERLFLLSSGLGILGLVLTNQVWEPERTHSSAAQQQQPQRGKLLWRLLWSPRLRIPTLVMLLIGTTFGILSTFVPLFIQETKVGLNPGLFYTAAAIAGFISRLFVGQASDRWGRGLFITLGLIAYTVAMLILFQATSSALFLLAGLVEGFGGGVVIPIMVALISDRSEPQERGRVFSVCLGGFDVGIAIAGPCMGFVAQYTGYRGLFGLATGLTILAIVLFATQSSKDVGRSLQFAIGRGSDVYALSK
jgi:MFS family permease